MSFFNILKQETGKTEIAINIGGELYTLTYLHAWWLLLTICYHAPLNLFVGHKIEN